MTITRLTFVKFLIRDSAVSMTTFTNDVVNEKLCGNLVALEGLAPRLSRLTEHSNVQRKMCTVGKILTSSCIYSKMLGTQTCIGNFWLNSIQMSRTIRLGMPSPCLSTVVLTIILCICTIIIYHCTSIRVYILFIMYIIHSIHFISYASSVWGGEYLGNSLVKIMQNRNEIIKFSVSYYVAFIRVYTVLVRRSTSSISQ